MSARDLARTAPVPHPPPRRSVWTIRGAALVMLALWGVVAWLSGAPVGGARLALLVVAAGLAVAGAGVMWRWAARARLTSDGQRTVSEVLHTTHRDAVKRALRGGDPMPAELRPWARAYAEGQQSTVLPASGMLLSGALQLASAAAQTVVWVSLTGGAVLVLGGMGVLWWSRRLRRAAARTLG